MSWLDLLSKEPPEPEKPIAVGVIGNVEPDMHTRPKDMVRRAMKRAGIKMIDLGGDVPAERFASAVKENNADLLVLSANTAPSRDNLEYVNMALEEEGLKGKVIVMVGGAAVSKTDAEKMGALWGRSLDDAAKIAVRAIKEKKGS